MYHDAKEYEAREVGLSDEGTYQHTPFHYTYISKQCKALSIYTCIYIKPHGMESPTRQQQQHRVRKRAPNAYVCKSRTIMSQSVVLYSSRRAYIVVAVAANRK